MILSLIFWYILLQFFDTDFLSMRFRIPISFLFASLFLTNLGIGKNAYALPYKNLVAISRRTSKGSLLLPNGDKYVGDFVKGKFNGTGTLIRANGDKYVGEFVKGKFNGTGTYSWGSALLQSDQPANVVFAGPASGAAAPTSFRNLVDADLPTSGVTPGTYGSSSAIPVVAINDKGVITGVSTASFQTGLDYQGTWNASTNTPTLTSSSGVAGYYYIVNVAGTTNLDGITDWQVGDWAVFSSTGVWQKIDQSNTVTSVNGQVGAVTLTASDVGAVPTNGTGATGTWAISITGNAATATQATNVAGGDANRIVYNTAANTSDFLPNGQSFQ